MYTRQLIGGEWAEAVGGGTWPLIDPSTESVIADVAFGDARDVEAAIESAAAAASEWEALGAYGRARVLRTAASLIVDRATDYAEITTIESGKPLAQSKAEWLSATTYLEFAGEEATRTGGRIIPSRHAGRRIDVTYAPIGVVGVIAAWNFPVYNINRAVSSALAAGCPVVIRPSEHTPRSAFAYGEALVDAGVPAGVVNIVNGDAHSMGQAMLDDPRLRKIQFTGSSRVGRILMDGASRTITRLSLELGGNAPVVVMEDVADLDAVAAGAVRAKYRNGGQVCIAPQRFIVHASIADDFTELVTKGSADLVVGPPDDPTTDVGPMINARQRDRVARIVTETADSGATVTTGGRAVDRPGYFYEPTVVAGAPPDSAAMTEEVFGPVLPVTRFESVDEAVALANAGDQGLTAFVWTSDLTTALTVSERLEYGMIGINDWYPVTAEAPFGGMRQSGLGRESGAEGIHEYLETRTRYFGGLRP